MKVNQNIAILGQRVVLVPYRREHVQKYHQWMSDPELRELTASEPLSLEEEYEMQRKWQDDEDKLTFIVLARNTSAPNGFSNIHDISQMIGDVNLFFKGSPDDEDFEVEAEIMIAENDYRRKGYASEALQLLFSFAMSHTYPPLFPITADKLVARIGESNGASIALFAKLGFVVTKRVKVFEEVEMRLADHSASKVWASGVRTEV